VIDTAAGTFESGTRFQLLIVHLESVYRGNKLRDAKDSFEKEAQSDSRRTPTDLERCLVIGADKVHLETLSLQRCADVAVG
jgi:hypothetical protein